MICMTSIVMANIISVNNVGSAAMNTTTSTRKIVLAFLSSLINTYHYLSAAGNSVSCI